MEVYRQQCYNILPIALGPVLACTSWPTWSILSCSSVSRFCAWSVLRSPSNSSSSICSCWWKHLVSSYRKADTHADIEGKKVNDLISVRSDRNQCQDLWLTSQVRESAVTVLSSQTVTYLLGNLLKGCFLQGTRYHMVRHHHNNKPHFNHNNKPHFKPQWDVRSQSPVPPSSPSHPAKLSHPFISLPPHSLSHQTNTVIPSSFLWLTAIPAPPSLSPEPVLWPALPHSCCKDMEHKGSVSPMAEM